MIGIVRGAAKTQLVRSLGFNDAIDASEGELAAPIVALAPKGINAFFGNVGTTMLDAALVNLAQVARIVICGATAHYDGPAPITNHLMLAMRGATMAGFFYFDHVARWAEGLARLAGWLQSGAIGEALDIAKGFDAVPEAALVQFTGGNAGCKLVRLSGDR